MILISKEQCPPCNRLKKKLNDMGYEKNSHYVELDYRDKEAANLIERHSIRSVPALIKGDQAYTSQEIYEFISSNLQQQH